MTEITCHGRTWRVEITDGECTITDPDGNIAHRSSGHESTAVHLAMALDARRYGETYQKAVCTCHERDGSFVCEYCYSQGYRGHMQE